MTYTNKKLHRIIFLLTLIMLVLSAANAQEIIDRPSPPKLVNDFVGFLSTKEKNQLEAKLVNYANNTSTQIAIVLIPSLQGYDISQYGAELALKWGIGTKGKDNGLLILASKEERKITIQTGYGLEEKIPDITAARIIRNVITPTFKAGNYYHGLHEATNQIISILKGEFVNENKGVNSKKKGTRGFGSWFWVIFIIIFILSMFNRRGRDDGSNRGRGGGFWLFPFFPFGGIGGGQFTSGGYSDYGGGSFGGIGGFGGGDFGGGGASGDW